MIRDEIREAEEALQRHGSLALMTNFNHTIDEQIAERLKNDKTGLLEGEYAARNFCGYVRWKKSRSVWECEIWRHHMLVAKIASETLEGIMRIACAEHGAE